MKSSQDRRNFAMFMIMIAVGMLVYSYYSSKQQRLQREQQGMNLQVREQTPEAGTAGNNTVEDQSGKTAPVAASRDDIGGEAEPVRNFTVRTGEMRVRLSSRGAGIEHLELLNHHPSASEQDKPIVLLDARLMSGGLNGDEPAGRSPEKHPSLVVRAVRGGADFENYNWKLVRIGKSVPAEGREDLGEFETSGDLEVEFAARRGNIEIRKVITFKQEGFDIGCRIVTVNRAPAASSAGNEGIPQISYKLIGAAGMILDEEHSKFNRLSAALGGRDNPSADMEIKTVYSTDAPGYVSEQKLEKLELSKSFTEWAMLRGRYFAVTLMPVRPEEMISAFTEPLTMNEREDQRKNLLVGLGTKDNSFSPGTQVVHDYLLRAGPQQLAQLEKYSYSYQDREYSRELGNTIDFGWSWFSGLAKLLLKLMRLIHDLGISNYGLAVVLLTLVVKMALHPLSMKGQKSMQRMQELQPKIQELQKQLKNEPQKLQQAQMRLFKEEGVNPAGGCLPMFLQMPVFISLYGAIRGAFVFRQAGFMWINDLSRPDATFDLSFWPHQLNILPLVYGAMMAVQMMSQPLPKEGQARQSAMMMRFMPLMFFVFIYRLPSAFVLYFTASSIIGFIESRWIKRQLKRDKELREAAAEAAASGRPIPKKHGEEPGPRNAADFWKAEAEKKKKRK